MANLNTAVICTSILTLENISIEIKYCDILLTLAPAANVTKNYTSNLLALHSNTVIHTVILCDKTILL
jgi:hypothetical protein